MTTLPQSDLRDIAARSDVDEMRAALLTLAQVAPVEPREPTAHQAWAEGYQAREADRIAQANAFAHSLRSDSPKYECPAPTVNPYPAAQAAPVDAPSERDLDLYDEIECDLAHLFGRASIEGHESGQRLAGQVKDKMQRARAAALAGSVPAEPTAEPKDWAAEAMKWRRKYAELRYPGLTREMHALNSQPTAQPAPASGLTDALAVIKAKSARATLGQAGAGAAFVTYDGAAADLNELARYIARLENAILAASRTAQKRGAT